MNIDKFKLQELNFGYKSLEPYMDEETLIIHHQKHHYGYMVEMNSFLNKYSDFSSFSLLELINMLPFIYSKMNNNQRYNSNTMAKNNFLFKDLSLFDLKKIFFSIKHYGGGVLNHNFFWKCLTDSSILKPMDELMEILIKNFGSFENFKLKFIERGLEVFGSGWVWLVLSKNKRYNNEIELKIIKTKNQNNPLNFGFQPLLGCDLWEHSYYLKYKNNRKSYLENWWNIVNWPFVLEEFKKSIKK